MDKQIKKYCEGLDCDICDEKEPCIYKIANELEEKLQAKEQECEQLKENVKHWQMEHKEAKAKGEWTYDLINKRLNQQLDQLKAENEQLKKELFSFMNGDYCANHCSLKQLLDKLNAEVELLRQYKGSKQASYETMQREWNEAKNEVKKLKAEIEELEYIIANKSCLTYRDFKCTKAYYTDKRLKQALQEIKEVAKELLQTKIPFCTIHEKIMEIISEVEDGNKILR